MDLVISFYPIYITYDETGEENTSPTRKKSECEALSPKLSRAATTIAEEAVDQLQASEKLIAGIKYLLKFNLK